MVEGRIGFVPLIAPEHKTSRGNMKIYRLKVSIIGIPGLYRVIELSGNCTFDDLHEAIFDAFDRFDDHLYSFYITRKPTKNLKKIIEAPEITSDMMVDDSSYLENAPKSASGTKLDDINLNEKEILYYLFDFGDEWWHRIRVESIKETKTKRKFVSIVKVVGESPSQYPDYEE